MTKHIEEPEKSEKSGFTIIEVMLVLGLTGMLLVGLLGGTFASIASQRYSDSVRSFAEYLRQEYSEVLSPESLGAGNSQRYAIYGKALVFGYDYDNDDDDRKVYSAILIGDAKIPESIDGGFIKELANVNLQLYCGQELGENSGGGVSSVSYYEPLWQSNLTKTKPDQGKPFTGTVIIARTPTSGAIHTVYTPRVYDLRDKCGNGNYNASSTFKTDLSEFAKADNEAVIDEEKRFYYQNVGICVTSENATRYREVRIAKDGHNTSAISTLSTDIQDDWLGKDAWGNTVEGNQCNE